MNRKKRRVAGAIAIEAVLSLTVFMLAILALLMGSMLMHAQAQMQYALNQTAKEISGYFYLLDKFGVASALSQKTTDTAAANVQQLNDSIGHIVSFSGEIKNDIGEIEQEATETIENAKAGNLTDEDIARLKSIGADEKDKIEAEVETIKDDIQLLKKADKKEMFKGVLQVFSRALINTAFSEYVTPLVCEVLVPKYLTQGDEDTYFNALGIDPTSISFKGSQMLGDGRTINLVVTYTVDASKLTLGFYKKELHFRHVASTCAWVRENSSGSLVSLSTVDDYFDPEYMAQRAEELAKLREEQEAEKAAREEAEKNLRDEFDELNSSIHSEESSEMDHGIEPLEEEDEAVDDEAVKEFIEKYPEGKALYEKYGPDVITAVNKCSDPNAAITLLLNAEKGNPAYGEEAVQALKKGGDDAVAALNKVPSKECAQVVAANGSRAAVIIAANGKDAVTAIGSNDSPIDAIKAIERANNAADRATVIQALNLAPTQDCAVAIMRCKDATAAEAIIAVGKDRAVEAADAINNSEDLQSTADAIKKLKGDALDVFKKVGTSKLCTDVLKTDGFEAAYILINYSKKGLQLYKNGVSTDQILALESHGLTPDVFAAPGKTGRHCDNKEEAQKLLESYDKIHSEFTKGEIEALKQATVAYEAQLKAEGKKNAVIKPAVAGVYDKKNHKIYYATNALRPEDEKGHEIKSESAPIPNPCDPRLKTLIDNMPDDIEAKYHVQSKGKGSHAEIYAVNQALLAGADPKDILIYVNHASGSESETKYTPFVTCPHCEYILQGFNVLSNVEI